MNKDVFNSLDIMDQVAYINNQLKLNKSLTQISKDLNIGRSTIRERFKKINYIYSKDNNQYLLDNGRSTPVINNKITPVIKEDVVNDIVNKSDIEVKETLLDIVNNYSVLKEMIELHKNNSLTIKQQININLDTTETKLATVRFNLKELELFNEFCKNNSQYKKVDLISMALKEFREKHE